MYTNYDDPIRNECVSILNKVINNEKKTRLFEKNMYNHVITQSKELYIYISMFLSGAWDRIRTEVSKLPT